MESPKTPKGARTKRRILESSLQLFRERGFDNVTLNEMCRAAGVAPGTFYHYYSSRADILWELLRVEGEELVAFFRSLDGDPLSQLQQILDYQISYYEKKGRDLVAHIYRMELERGEAGLHIEKLIPLRDILQEVIARGQAEGRFQTGASTGELTELLLAQILYHSFLWVKDPQGPPLERHLRSSLPRLMGLLLPENQ